MLVTPKIKKNNASCRNKTEFVNCTQIYCYNVERLYVCIHGLQFILYQNNNKKLTAILSIPRNGTHPHLEIPPKKPQTIMHIPKKKKLFILTSLRALCDVSSTKNSV